MPRALAEEIAWDFWNNTEDLGEVMLSGENMSYLMERGHGVVDRIKFIGNNYTVITDPAQIPEDIVKVSVYLVDGVEPFVERFVPKWQQANCAVAGPKWIDTTVANKGIGVQSICRCSGAAPALCKPYPPAGGYPACLPGQAGKLKPSESTILLKTFC